MGRFLREYWIWIAIPFLIVAGIVAFVLLSGSGEETSTPFSYPIY